MNRRGIAPLFIVAIVFTVLVVGAGATYYFQKPSAPEQVSCTMDAKLCPDGSYVGRTGPKCEFAKCPGEGVVEKGSGIRGTVLLGPTCPVMRNPPDPECADKPYATKLVVTSADQARVIKEFNSDAKGNFSADIPLGDYAIRSAAAANVWPYCGSETINVNANAFTETTVYCDTGIR